MTPKKIDKAAKKQEILEAAMKLFARNGVTNTKMAHIAEAAGVGKGTIYEYFRSKEDIFASAYHHMFAETEELIEKVLQSNIGPEERLKAVLGDTIEALLGDGGEFAGIMMEFWSEGIRSKDDRILKIINLDEIYRQYRQIISEILEEGISQGIFRRVDTHLTASALIGAMDGLFLQWILEPGIFEPREATDVLIDCYLNGIKKR
jgi:AcrR family transcriptional regulator